MYKDLKQKRMERTNNLILGFTLGFAVTICGMIYLVMSLVS